MVIAILAGVSGVATADTIANSKAEADKLFFEGRALLEKNKPTEACAKFDLAFKKDPYAIGILLNLGLCKETIGQVATAYRLFSEARQRAKDQSLGDYLEAMNNRLALIAPRIPHVKVTIAKPEPELHVLIDDIVYEPERLGDVMLDPGTHTIVVTARERLPFSKTITVKEGERTAVEIPPLERGIIVQGDRRRPVGKLLVGVGAGLVATSVVLGYFARERYWAQFPSASRDGEAAHDVEHDCWTVDTGDELAKRCNADGAAKLDGARLLAHVGTGAGILGLLAVGGGVYLWITAPKYDRPAATVRLDLARDYAGVAFTRGF